MALEVRALNKAFGIGNSRTQILKRFSMRVEDGEMVAIVGKKRSGKTTLMNILSGMSLPDSGTYSIDGKPLQLKNPFAMAKHRRRRVGVITREPLLVQDMTVYENIMLPLFHRFMSAKEKQRRAKELLRSLGMKGMGKYYPRELTELEQQKVCAARAMITEPKYLLADEPTGCLQSSDVDRFLDFLEVLNSAGYTIIIATHSKRVASRCRRLIPIVGYEPAENAQMQGESESDVAQTPSGSGQGAQNYGAGELQGNSAEVKPSTVTAEEEAYLRGIETPEGSESGATEASGRSGEEAATSEAAGEFVDETFGESTGESEGEPTIEELEAIIRRNLSAMGMAETIRQVEQSVEEDEEKLESAIEAFSENNSKPELEDLMEEELERKLQRNVESWM